MVANNSDITTKTTATASLIEVIIVQKKKLNWPGSRDFVLPASQSHSEIREEEEEVAGGRGLKEEDITRKNKLTKKNRTKQKRQKASRSRQEDLSELYCEEKWANVKLSQKSNLSLSLCQKSKSDISLSRTQTHAAFIPPKQINPVILAKTYSVSCITAQTREYTTCTPAPPPNTHTPLPTPHIHIERANKNNSNKK